MAVRIVLAEDHQVLRQALSQALSARPDLEVVGEAGDGREAIQLVEQLKPDLIVMDISLPRLNGIEAATQIRVTAPDTQVVILSRHLAQAQVTRALNAGAKGYVLKRDALNELLLAIKTICDGYYYLSPAVMRPVIDGYLEWVREYGRSPLDRLTDRERQVLQLVAEGNSSRQIAEELQIQSRTIEAHRASLMTKLNLTNVVELVHFAIEHGVIGVFE